MKNFLKILDNIIKVRKVKSWIVKISRVDVYIQGMYLLFNLMESGLKLIIKLGGLSSKVVWGTRFKYLLGLWENLKLLVSFLVSDQTTNVDTFRLISTNMPMLRVKLNASSIETRQILTTALWPFHTCHDQKSIDRSSFFNKSLVKFTQIVNIINNLYPLTQLSQYI